ncbi:MAG: phosphoglycerate kinase, partial [SAR116 cluster bacterium]|nr:phosphoglycerate kinase [SAR116 cluster bacterium]
MDDNSILNINIKDKRIIVRADLNVPMKNNRITDDTRVIRFCKGIRKLCEKGAKIIILTHLGRPKGKYDPELSTKILVDSLEKNLNKKIIFSDNCTDPMTLEKSKNLTNNQVLLCENLRYHKEEEENDLDFAKKLSQLGEYFVNDAFSCSHRAHASTASITAFLPSFFGPMMNEEINALNKTLEKPKRPSLAIIGGSKVSTKISVLKNLVTKLDNLIIGGGMANTFLFAKGLHVGNSIYEPLLTDTVEEINKLAKINNCKIHLPIDVIIAKELSENIEFKSVNND